MPTLKHLLEELRQIKVDPDDVRIPVNFMTISSTTPKISPKKTQSMRKINPFYPGIALPAGCSGVKRA
jgi:hypothetical protein